MSFQEECITKRKEGARLTTLVKHYQKYNPLLDEQICLAHVIYTLVEADIKVTQREIYYCFKKNYNRDLHGDVQSYVTWLYSLAHPSKKRANNSISNKSKACSTPKIDLVLDCKGNTLGGLE